MPRPRKINVASLQEQLNAATPERYVVVRLNGSRATAVLEAGGVLVDWTGRGASWEAVSDHELAGLVAAWLSGEVTVAWPFVPRLTAERKREGDGAPIMSEGLKADVATLMGLGADRDREGRLTELGIW